MTRRLGRISKRGDRYLRMLLTHGARSVLRAATVADRQGRRVDDLRRWALSVQSRTHHNRATCALANKMARICYAVLRDHQDYGGVGVDRKMRQTYAADLNTRHHNDELAPSLAKRLIAHHGTPGRPHTA